MFISALQNYSLSPFLNIPLRPVSSAREANLLLWRQVLDCFTLSCPNCSGNSTNYTTQLCHLEQLIICSLASHRKARSTFVPDTKLNKPDQLVHKLQWIISRYLVEMALQCDQTPPRKSAPTRQDLSTKPTQCAITILFTIAKT